MRTQEEVLVINRENDFAPEAVATEVTFDDPQKNAVEQARQMIDAIFSNEFINYKEVERSIGALDAYEQRKEKINQEAQCGDLAHEAEYYAARTFRESMLLGSQEQLINTSDLMLPGKNLKKVREAKLSEMQTLQKAA
jgi:hypothetical protein